MGLISLVKNSFAVGTSNAREERLADEIEVWMRNVAAADENLRVRIAQSFIDEHAKIKVHRSESEALRLELGRSIRKEAERLSRHQVSNSAEEARSYGLWLAGAWLEVSTARTERAYLTFIALEEMLTL
ncbi:hypothetical protein [Pseudoduganella violaceinigra]|uniref:hypothetical protein n=1 Tax=Pseudoduganella violaceinigra TaxID=246602 RepID=UPI00048540CF|nr:hypothetical protein [Pseudoduganella violaceinigra]